MLQEKWIWDWDVLKYCSALPVALTAMLGGGLYPLLGKQALLMLGVAAAYTLVGLSFWAVGYKIRKLHRSLEVGVESESAESLIVHGVEQSPGVAVLRQAELLLARLEGEPIAVALEDIRGVEHVTWLNGRKLWGKKGLVLETISHGKVGLALPRSIGERWAKRLKRR